MSLPRLRRLRSGVVAGVRLRPTVERIIPRAGDDPGPAKR